MQQNDEIDIAANRDISARERAFCCTGFLQTFLLETLAVTFAAIVLEAFPFMLIGSPLHHANECQGSFP
jgi:hypothetical protein